MTNKRSISWPRCSSIRVERILYDKPTPLAMIQVEKALTFMEPHTQTDIALIAASRGSTGPLKTFNYRLWN